MYFSPQSSAWTEPGHVLLVRKDGTSTALQTSGMDVASLVWTKTGLYYSDTERDYLLADRLNSWPSPKTNAQESALILPSGDHVSLFNKGVIDGNYLEEVVVNNGVSSTKYEVDGYNQAVAVCGEEVFAVAELTGQANRDKARAAGVDLSQRMPQMLHRIYPAPSEPGAGFVAAYATEEANYLVSDEACDEDGVMHYLVETLDQGGTYHHYARSWDTRTGTATQYPVVDRAGKPMFTQESFTFPQASTELTAGGGLAWIGEDGHVNVTDPDTGVTDTRWESGRTLGSSSGVEAAFDAEHVWILEASAATPSDLTLSRYTILDGDGGVILTIPGARSREGLSQVRRGFAVNPNWSP